jgi:O-succinylbenzoic acid--CoA ligase
MTTRRCLHAAALGAADPTELQHAMTALEAALDGSGPALLPLPPHPRTRRQLTAALRPDDPAHPLERDDVALVMPTSGSTGDPKGVLLTAENLSVSASASQERLGGPGRWLLALPLTHIAGVQVLVRSIIAGTTPQVQPVEDGFRVEDFILATAALHDAGPLDRRYTALVPTALARLLGGGATQALSTYDGVLVGAAATPPALLDRARDHGINVITTYGMTETSGGCVYDGAPLPGVSLSTTTDHRLRVRGPMVFAGYRLRPDLTAAALQDGWHLTNDLATITADGTLEVLGRTDDVIVTGGVNVAPRDVVAALHEHPGVRQADVHGRPDPTWGQRVVAVIVPTDPTNPPTLRELRASVGERLGGAAAPRALMIVTELPMLDTGKPDREALRRLTVKP